MTGPDEAGTGGDVLAEELSALLDGEVAPDRVAELRVRLERDPQARALYEDLGQMRQAVRDLPPVDPPFGFFEQMLLARRGHRHRHRRRLALGAVAATVAAFLLLAGLTPAGDRIVPPVEAFAERHGSLGLPEAERVGAASYGPVDLLGQEPVEDSLLPASLAGLPRLAAYETGDVIHVVYGQEAVVVSVFEQPRHSVDWTSMPADGERMVLDEAPAWTATRHRQVVLVVERPSVVFTIVTTSMGEAPELTELAGQIPEPAPPTLLDKARSAGQNFARTFGLDA